MILTGSVAAACATSPTGQKQLKLFPEATIAEMGVTAFQQIKQKTPVSKDSRVNRYVNCVADAVTRQVGQNTRWEVTVFDDDAANAFALPGGKIGVYTGLLKVAANQDQLATVLAHEVAHVLANHGNARISAAYATEAGLQLAQALAGTPSAQTNQLLGLLGLGAQVGVLLPYGRGQESEADILGLGYMARAGFDPRESIGLWQNMARANKRQPPEFLSTHPAHGTRIDDLQRAMPGALKAFNAARAGGRNPQCR
ncbi:MAG: M48 family metallopeptidase [Gammaproteobacteria bacterium]|nr:M48 family metallopeptidase [Gammaproteobacteria bacterium]